MRPVYMVSGGVSKFTKARPDVAFQPMVKGAYDYALKDLELDVRL
jgi:acetyl-CoA C-acetyltransferase